MPWNQATSFVLLVLGLMTGACLRDPDGDCGMCGSGDTESDDSDWGSDTNTDTATGEDTDCGAAGAPCCDASVCDGEELFCATAIWSETGSVCTESCILESCEPEGFADLWCSDVTQGAGICGLAVVIADEDGMGSGNACSDSGMFARYCCPEVLGGDALGFGDGGSTICNGIDLSTLEVPENDNDILTCGVGICLFGPTDQRWCALPCATEVLCEGDDTCMEVSEGFGACVPYEM